MTQHVFFFLPSWMESREACPEPRHGAYQHLRHVDLQQLTQEPGHYVTEGVDLESMGLAVNMFRKKNNSLRDSGLLCCRSMSRVPLLTVFSKQLKSSVITRPTPDLSPFKAKLNFES